MLTQAQQQRGQQPRTTPVSLSSPYGGWNTRDPLDQMAPTDAVVLDNWTPLTTGLTVRGGSNVFASGMGSGPAETIAEFVTGTTRQMIVGASGSLWNASGGGVVTDQLATGFTSNAWQTVNFNQHLFLQNGIDTPQRWDGTTMVDPVWTNVGEDTLQGAITFATRLWFWAVTSPIAYYGGVNAITGDVTAFDLSTVTQMGGNILAITTMSHDGGSGLNDLLCFIMTTGEVIIYEGTDPSDPSTFSIDGRYRMGAPVNTRAVARYGADSYVVTNEDHTSLSLQLAALRSGSYAPKTKICNALQAEVIENGASFGWQIQVYPKSHAIIVNIPQQDSTFVQHVFYTDQQAWCRWKGLNSYCFGLFNNSLYFGSLTGTVYAADTGNSDSGTAIQAVGQQAWTPLQASPDNNFNATYRKRLSAVRPIVQSLGSISYSFGIGYDYQSPMVSAPTSTPSVGSLWNVSPWNTSPWSSSATIDTHWRMAGGTGQSVSFQLNCAALQPITWFRTDLRTETGRAL